MSKRKFTQEGGVYTRTRKRTKLAEYKGKGRLQHLPVEIIWKIFDYLDDDTILKVPGICPVLSKASTLVFYHRYNTIPNKILTVKDLLYHKLYSGSIGEETKRLDITKSLLYLDWMETELIMLEGILLRYDVDSENPLFKQLWHVLAEMLERIDSLTKCVPFRELLADVRVANPSTSLPLWTSFIEHFDQDLEPSLGRSLPFETRVLDILSCCPSANFDLTIKRSSDDNTVIVRAFFQIQDTCCERYRPKFEGNSDEDFEKGILRYLRSSVRARNSILMTDIFDDIRNLECRLLSAFLNETDRSKAVVLLEDRYRRLIYSCYEPLNCLCDSENTAKRFVRRSSYSVSNNFLECFLEKGKLRPGEMPLLGVFPELFKAEASSTKKSRGSGWRRHPFELRVVYKRWWQDINIVVRKEERNPEESESLSYRVEQTVEPSS